MRRILLIEDDDEIVELIKTLLKDESVEINHVANGIEGLELILSDHSKYDLILVDRVLPGIDGIDILKKIKLNQEVINTPIIMATSSSKDEVVSQGIKAGAFYYLIKPLRKKSFLTVINRAFEHVDNIRNGLKYYDSFRGGISCFTHLEAKLSNHKSVLDLAYSLSFLFDDAARAFRGLYELLLNSVEHGIYGLGEKKNDLVIDGKYKDFLNDIDSDEKKTGEVSVIIKRELTSTKITITDPGPGFNWTEFLSLDPSNSNKETGRGIAYAKEVCFDELTFNKEGNEVTATMFKVNSFL